MRNTERRIRWQARSHGKPRHKAAMESLLASEYAVPNAVFAGKPAPTESRTTKPLWEACWQANAQYRTPYSLASPLP
ncbi:hypothetical protein, partial [Alcanivorax sp. 24]|uniref:hypothetical protein n=1 Tax=Alcanivorax sp. 24 TaxID=2545266 RepID=UPI00196A61F9